MCEQSVTQFGMTCVKPVGTPLVTHFKLTRNQASVTEKERDHMSNVPYASEIGSLMYAMVCTRPDISYAI